MLKQRIIRGGTLLALLWASPLLAQTQTLQSLLQEYREASPSLKAEAFRVDALRENASRASAYPAPEISLEWGSQEGMYYGGVVVGQEFMFPGKRSAMEKAEAERVPMAKADYQGVAREGEFRIASYYLEIYELQQRERILDSTVTLVNSIQESARRRFETGMGSLEEIFRLQSERTKLRSDSLNLAGKTLEMRYMLSASVGDSLAPEIPDSIAFSLESLSLPTLDSLIKLSLTKPELVSMGAEKSMAAKELHAAQLQKMPDLMVQGKYMNMMGPDEWSVMVGVKMPIAPWSSMDYRSKEKAAKAKEQEAMAREQAMKNMFREEVRQAYSRYQIAEKRSQQINKEQVTAANSAFHATQIAYASGKSDLTMSLDALRMALMSWEMAVMARTNVIQSILNLEKTAGVSPGTWLLETTLIQGVSP